MFLKVLATVARGCKVHLYWLGIQLRSRGAQKHTEENVKRRAIRDEVEKNKNGTGSRESRLKKIVKSFKIIMTCL